MMKQGTLAVCVAAALGVSTVNAFDLQVNGQTLEGVNVERITISESGDSINIITNAELVVTGDPLDTDGDGTPDETDDDDDNDGVLDVDDDCRLTGPADDRGCPDSDNDGVRDIDDSCPNQGPDEDGNGCPVDEEPPPSDDCVDSDFVECAYNISASAWNSSARTLDTINIPVGKVLVSSFTTGSGGSISSAKFSYRTPVGGHTEGVNLWISEQVLGTTLSSRCDLDNAQYAFQMKVTLGSSWYCVLEPNTTYYMHVEHVDPRGRSMTMYRELTTN